MTTIISEKEKKSSSYKEGRLDSLSDEKKAKMKKFAKEYVAKIMRKLEKSHRHKGFSSSSHLEREASTSTKHSPHGEEHASPADDAMDVDDDHEQSDGELDADAEGEVDGEGEFEGEGLNHAPSPDYTPPASASKLQQQFPFHPLPSKPESVADPRIRRRKEGSGWDDEYERPRGLPGFQDLSIVS